MNRRLVVGFVLVIGVGMAGIAAAQIDAGMSYSHATVTSGAPTDTAPATASARDAVRASAAAVPRRTALDFDGDGKSDPTVIRDSGSGLTWYQWRSSTGPHAVRWGIAGDTPVPADYDGDGKTDVAIYRSGYRATWFIIPSSTNTPVAITWGTQEWLFEDYPVPADYDGDGKADIAVYRYYAYPSRSSGPSTWFIIPSTTNTPIAVTWGQSGSDIPVPADYDGDGKADVAVYRRSPGQIGMVVWSTWYLVKTATNVSVAVPWGEGDYPVPADYDGDGKADVAVFRADGCLWLELLSASGQPYGAAWGAWGDLPFAADYDGDGKADPTVFREGTWFQLRTSAGPVGFLWGQAGDIVPTGYTFPSAVGW